MTNFPGWILLSKLESKSTLSWTPALTGPLIQTTWEVHKSMAISYFNPPRGVILGRGRQFKWLLQWATPRVVWIVFHNEQTCGWTLSVMCEKHFCGNDTYLGTSFEMTISDKKRKRNHTTLFLQQQATTKNATFNETRIILEGIKGRVFQHQLSMAFSLAISYNWQTNNSNPNGRKLVLNRFCGNFLTLAVS